MVREFPHYRPPAPEPRAWDQNYSNVFQASVKAQAAGSGNESKNGFNNVYPPGLISCRAAGTSHPLALYVGDNPLKTPFTVLLLEIFLVIIATRIVRHLLKPLRQPRIVSEIIVSRPVLNGPIHTLLKYVIMHVCLDQLNLFHFIRVVYSLDLRY